MPDFLNQKTVESEYTSSGKAEFFSSLVIKELGTFAEKSTRVLDIGCGGGFHHRDDIQKSIGALTKDFVGIEPDPEAKCIPNFSIVHHTSLEDAPIPAASVDLAYCVMVLEHVMDPVSFFSKLDKILSADGVFYGFTVDSRHWFGAASSLLQNLGLKDLYLNLLRGNRGVDRYENFPTAYRCNTPTKLVQFMPAFDVTVFSLHKIGQMDFYMPKILKPLSHLIDRFTIFLGLPGSVLVVRAKRRTK